MILPDWWFRWWNRGQALRFIGDDDMPWITAHLQAWELLHERAGLGAHDYGKCMWYTDRPHTRARTVLWHIDKLDGTDLDRVAHFEGWRSDSMRRQVHRLRKGLVVPFNELGDMVEYVLDNR